MKRKKLTKDQQLNRYKVLQNILVSTLEQIQKKHLREPNPDWHEYCKGCGNSPYDNPPHQPGCLVVALKETLRVVKEAMEE